MTYPPWLVPALATACLVLLGVLLKLYLQDRQQNADEHVALGKRIDLAKNEVKGEIKDLAAKVDAFTGVVRELTGYLRGFKDGQSSGGRDGGPRD